MDWNAVSAIASSISTLVAASAIYISTNTSRRLQDENLKYNRRQSLLPFWKEMLELARIDPEDPNQDAFRTSINLLLLVAQFEKLEIVEASVLREVFATAFKQVYSDIAATNGPISMNGMTKPGRDFLIDNPGLKALFDKW